MKYFKPAKYIFELMVLHQHILPSQGPQTQSEIRKLSQSINTFTIENAAFNQFLKDESYTFLKFLPPFSSFLMETLHLQESRTPVEELAAI